jgi:hypoxanthine-guanine phosphoribosyltransferase
MNEESNFERPNAVIGAEQIQKRVREMARQISDDYQGKTIYVLAVLENGFMFVADLVRSLEVPLICQAHISLARRKRSR